MNYRFSEDIELTTNLFVSFNEYIISILTMRCNVPVNVLNNILQYLRETYVLRSRVRARITDREANVKQLGDRRGTMV